MCPLIGHSVFTLQLLQDLGGTIFLCKMDLLWLYVLFEVWHVTVADLDSVNALLEIRS